MSCQHSCQQHSGQHHSGQHRNDLGILARRRIEAEIIKPIYEILVRDFGKARAQEVIGEAVENAAIAAGKDFARREPAGADIQSFVALQYLWEKDDALEVKILSSDDRHFDYDVHRCRYAEMYHEMGLGEIGHLLSCARDSKFIVGYAPEVKLTRTQTIMSGAPRCDFRYAVDKKDTGGGKHE
ncbi:L-2-amino-thiazoline-4-carboxylic acid hydrolase [Sodalis ligni]|uniref:L-2-amino-thiazoline-4-carboxylic acid hydrolase n=1 Tax=Sodalis ligni TaxID=2697027 RepID=UPI00193F10E3|nr:L-2-amino-thiazoline-4-carboxylic acid hydrolase [Sodalis ligni]QWA10796.1 L-2-amino-thiazoline-4-carboxylic acid hydrolase [Sodalis ligni]